MWQELPVHLGIPVKTSPILQSDSHPHHETPLHRLRVCAKQDALQGCRQPERWSGRIWLRQGLASATPRSCCVGS